MQTRERYPARWPSNRQALLVGCAFAGALVVGGAGALFAWSNDVWEWATAFGGVGAGAVVWVMEVLI